jgi:hypothetical protein
MRRRERRAAAVARTRPRAAAQRTTPLLKLRCSPSETLRPIQSCLLNTGQLKAGRVCLSLVLRTRPTDQCQDELALRLLHARRAAEGPR